MQNRHGISYSLIYFLESEIFFKTRGKMFSLLIKVANEHISRDKSMSLPLPPSFLANSKLKFDC